jgi:hypothetical protein
MPIPTFVFRKEKFSNCLLDAGWGRVAIGIFYPLGEARVLGGVEDLASE